MINEKYFEEYPELEAFRGIFELASASLLEIFEESLDKGYMTSAFKNLWLIIDEVTHTELDYCFYFYTTEDRDKFQRAYDCFVNYVNPQRIMDDVGIGYKFNFNL